MISNCWKSVKALALACTLGVAILPLATAPVAHAQEEETQTLSASVGKVIQEAYNDIQGDNVAGGIAKLDNLLASKGDSMTAYEKATVYELRGGAKVQLTPPNYAGALRDFESAIATGGLAASRTRQIRFNMAQLYFQEERFQDAINLFEDYIKWAQANGEDVNANTWYLLAVAYYQLDRFREARAPMERALAKLDKPNKSYYDIMNAIYSNIGDSTFNVRADLLVKMINYWPDSSSYWGQLAQVYQAAGNDREAASVLEAAYRAGLIKDQGQIRTLIQYYNFLDTPYRGAKLLAKEMAAGTFPRNADTLELLSQLWSQSREHGKAIETLRELARISPDGKNYYRLGQSLFADEQWEEAIKALEQGISKGLDAAKTGDAYVLIGTALFTINSDSRDQRQRARVAFGKAANYGGTARQRADEYIRYLRAVDDTECAIERQTYQIALENEKNRVKQCQAQLDIYNRGGTISPDVVQQCTVLVNQPEVTVEKTELMKICEKAG